MSAAWRRARADLWPLLLSALVVALTVGLTDAVPRLLTARADTAVRAAVAQADPSADLVITSMYGPGASDPSAGPEDTTLSVDDVARRVDSALPPSLQPILGAPVADATSTDLTLSTPGLPTGGVLWMSYLWAGQEPAVRWVSGGAPGRPRPDGPVQLALSVEVARVLGIGAGDTFVAVKQDRTTVPVLVAGVFVAVDPRDPAWTARPEVLRPRVVGPGDAPTTVVGGLLSAASLPAARAALEPDGVTRTFRFPVDPQQLDYAGAAALSTQVAALEASPDELGGIGPGTTVTSRLDLVLTQVRERVEATWSQATVALAGLACGAVLVLLVAADLLARRRSAALVTVRARGGTLPGAATAAGAEAALVVAAGAATGLTLGQVVAPGAVRGRGSSSCSPSASPRRPRSRRSAPPATTSAACRPTAIAADWRAGCARSGAPRSRPPCWCSRSPRWSPCGVAASCRCRVSPTSCSPPLRCSSQRRARSCSGARSP